MAEEGDAAPPDVGAPEGEAPEGEAPLEGTAVEESPDEKAEEEVEPEEEAKELTAAEAQAAYVAGLKMSTLSRWGLKKGRQKMPVDSTARVDVDRTALNAILDISSRIQSIQKKSRLSMSTLALGQETYKDKQVIIHKTILCILFLSDYVLNFYNV